MESLFGNILVLSSIQYRLYSDIWLGDMVRSLFGNILVVQIVVIVTSG